MATAEQHARAEYASREAAARRLERKLRQEQQIIEANTISADGVYVVGQDIKPGIYHTSGAPGGGTPGGACYYATLSSTNTSDIIDNNNFNGPDTVDVFGAYAFQISGGCTWRLISAGDREPQRVLASERGRADGRAGGHAEHRAGAAIGRFPSRPARLLVPGVFRHRMRVTAFSSAATSRAIAGTSVPGAGAMLITSYRIRTGPRSARRT